MQKRESISSNYDFGKIPPQSPDMEEAVLGALLLRGDSIYEIADMLTSESFYKDNHQKICQIIINLFESSRNIDILTVTEELRKQKQLEEVGGPIYISQLTSAVPNASHIIEHYQIVFQKYIQRELIRISSNLQSAAFDESADMQDLMDFANNEIDTLNEKTSGKRSSMHISTALDESEASCHAREKSVKEGKMRGIPTPWKDLNKLTQGWQSGLIVIGSRPSIGKTSIALANAKESARNGFPTLIFSLETSAVRLSDRLIMSQADMQPGNFRSGYMAVKDWSEFNKAKEMLRKLPIYIDDNPSVNFNYLKAKCRVMKKKGLCSLAIIDYLQLTEVDESKYVNRDRGLGIFTRKCKVLSRQLDLPIILLVQLNREVEARSDKKPQMSDIRETGSAEGDADVIIVLHRPEKYGITEDRKGNDLKGLIWLLLEKQKEGPIGEVKLKVNNTITKFFDYVENPFPQTSGKDKQIAVEKDDIEPEFDSELPF